MPTPPKKGAKQGIDLEKAAARRREKAATYRDRLRQKTLWEKRLSTTNPNQVFPTEMEHPIGYAAAGDLKRGETTLARKAEKDMSAYHEDKDRHRAHIGTGTKGYDADVGMSGNDYRDSQRKLLWDGKGATAVQLNQAAYALQERKGAPGSGNPFQQNTPSMSESDAHYEHMARYMPSFVSVQNGQEETAPVSEADRQSMSLAREAARTGKWPTEKIREWNAQHPHLPKSKS